MKDIAMRSAAIRRAWLVVAACVGCVACAHDRLEDPATVVPPFDGSWSVAWCSETAPRLDCGGFWITLVQAGARVCGDFSGALVNLHQIDEGIITGTAAGNVATLAVKSGRSDAVLQIRAIRVGRDIEWKQVGVIKAGGTDVDIIAIDDMLRPAAEQGHLGRETCETAER